MKTPRRFFPLAAGLVLCLWLVGSTEVIHNGRAADAPNRPTRADSFLGVHFDFHAGPDCQQVGARTTPEMVELVIDKVQPDYIQIDGKGHPGYSSYPTQVGNRVPGYVGDPLRVWRDVTRRRGVALFLHYSGVWDRHAVASHPEWAARNADGKPDTNATSVYGPYVDRLMIPQLRELAGQYGVDGAWVDGDCWGATLDYSEIPVHTLREQTGAESAPRRPGDPFWHEWMALHREGYRRYLRHYVDQLKSSHPRFEVISNWAFSDHMPEPVSADVAALSGDFAPDNSVNSARFSGRCLENQAHPWDLMSWSFSRKTRNQKPAVQLMQEAAVVLALGGGYQAYFKQDRDGAIWPEQMDTMAAVATFCRQRQRWCHRSAAIPQVALLYSTAGHYHSSPRLFHPSGSDGIGVLRKALTSLLDRQYAVQVLGEHHLRGSMSRWPLIVVPGWAYLDAAFRDELSDYARGGGRLLLIGKGPTELFAAELAEASQSDSASVAAVSDVDDTFDEAVRRLYAEPLVEVSGSNQVDVSPRKLGDRLTVHLVNTSGPHANAPDDGIASFPHVGPLTVKVRLPHAPKSMRLQPEGTSLPIAWEDGCAQVTVPQLDIYSILVVEN